MGMDWELAIERNREALMAIVMALMASLGLSIGGKLTTLPRFLYARAQASLRQAESAARRLIVMAAHALAQRGYKPRKPRAAPSNFALLPSPPQTRVPTFQLIDPLKTFGQETPDFDAFDFKHGMTASAANNTPVSAAALGLRLLALKNALETIPKQAKRLARWYSQRDHALKQLKPHRLSPIRPGPPPASRTAKRSELEIVLSECHSLANYAQDQHDSS
jgi:hypothetical protein